MENRKKRGGRLFGAIIAIVIILGALIVALTGFITDWMWFEEMGYVSVFFTEIKSKLMLGVPSFIITTLLCVVFLGWLKHSFLKKNNFTLNEKSKKRVRRLLWILSVVFGIVFAAITISNLWFEILEYINAGEFDITDPLFFNDIGFYVFKLEFLNDMSGLIARFAILLLLITVIFYLILVGSADATSHVDASTAKASANGDDVVFEYSDENGNQQSSGSGAGPDLSKIFNNGQINFDVKQTKGSLKKKLKALLGVAAGEISVIGILFFIAIAGQFYLMQFDLLYGGTGVAYGAGYADINVTLVVYKIVMICSLISAAMLIVGIKRKKILIAALFPAIIVVCLIIQGPVSSLVQNYIVSPDEINKEKEYIGYNIDYTRQAYDLSNISVQDYSPTNDLTKEDVLNNMETFSNIRINDFEPAEQFYNQTQSIRSYYTFNDVDVDRYNINGEYTQVFLAAREIDKTKLDDNWLIRHFKYTHGYGITLSRVDKVTSSGQPDMLIDSIPPVSEIPEIEITRPEIYYGESTDDYVIVGTSEQEFDYPSGENNVYCEYEGTGGIKLTPFAKLLFALREGSLKILVSGNIKSDSSIMIYRDIMERVQKIAPFLDYDNSPYLVVSDDGALYWMINAYTSSSAYPYSEPYNDYTDINYIRNSVKIIIDAYNGTTDFYISDETDPIVNTLAKIYPGLFKSMDEMPSDLRQHIQYPNALFNIQANVFMKYHMTDEAVFYQNEDLWAIANELYGQTEAKLSPINFIMKLPGEDKAEFISSIPYTPNGKSNMTGLLVARSDGENYGQLVLYRLPKDRIIYGPAQIEAQINQDAEISKEFSLWNNSGASYSRGNLFVFPVEGSLLYAEPIYMESSSSSLPEVKRVIMYYGDKVAYESTLAECLDTLFGEGAGAPLLTSNPIEEGRRMAEELNNASTVVEEPTTIIDEEPNAVEANPIDTTKQVLKELINETVDLLEKLKSHLEELE